MSMATLYQVPMLHGWINQTNHANLEISDALVRDEIATAYWKALIPSFMEQLRIDGLLNKKKRFVKPVHIFLDGIWTTETREFLASIRQEKAHVDSQMYELLTRLHAAGAVLQRTELACLLGHPFDGQEKLERRTQLRDKYIAHRVAQILSRQAEAVGVLIIGCGHHRLTLPSNIEVKIFHRFDILPRRYIEMEANHTAYYRECPFVYPDDFGHVAGYEEVLVGLGR